MPRAVVREQISHCLTPPCSSQLEARARARTRPRKGAECEEKSLLTHLFLALHTTRRTEAEDEEQESVTHTETLLLRSQRGQLFTVYCLFYYIPL